jgi:8-oxo-dGTP pyrophosphatase MutT (NUDIX family)
MIWTPHVTVAAVIEQQGRFLLVEEVTEDGVRFNQPAGHWEPGETLAEAVARETREEAAYGFTPEYLVGIYSWHRPRKDITYLRFTYAGQLGAFDPDQALDEGILRAVWLTHEEVYASRERHRSPLVLQNIEDFLAGRRYPMEIVHHYD